MGLLVAFAAGCFIGARAASEDFGDVAESFRAVRDSEEFHDLVAAFRSHAGQTLRRLAEMVETSAPATKDDEDLVARVRSLVRQD
jgi:hypothetical protein